MKICGRLVSSYFSTIYCKFVPQRQSNPSKGAPSRLRPRLANARAPGCGRDLAAFSPNRPKGLTAAVSSRLGCAAPSLLLGGRRRWTLGPNSKCVPVGINAKNKDKVSSTAAHLGLGRQRRLFITNIHSVVDSPLMAEKPQKHGPSYPETQPHSLLADKIVVSAVSGRMSDED